VGKAAIEAILEVRDVGKFESFADFLSRVDSRRVNKKVLESLIKVGAMGDFGKRASLLSSMDEIRGKVSKPKGNKDQQGLFSAEEMAESKKVRRIEDDTVEEFSDEELQSLERQLLGFSLSSRPIGELISEFEHEATHKIFEISPHGTLGELVRIAAVVSDIRIAVTRRSAQEMAFVRVEDGTGSLDLVVFPKIFAKTRNFWISNKPLLITGRVDSREEAATIIVEAIEGKGAKGPQDSLFVKIPKGTNENNLQMLKTLLLDFPGEQDVIIVFEGNNRDKIKLPFKVAWNETLARKISEVLNTTEKN